jgi:hypothetical protein
MKVPRMRPLNEAEDRPMERTAMNSLSPDRDFFGGKVGRLTERLRIAVAAAAAPSASFDGNALPRANDKSAANADIAKAWTWSKERLPKTRDIRVGPSSSSEVFAAVDSRAERFISRFPLRLFSIGMRINNSSRFIRADQVDTCSNNCPVNTIPTTLARSVGAVSTRIPQTNSI